MVTIGTKAALVGALAVGLLFVGCGSDDKASGGTGGSSGSGGVGGTPPPPPVMCGTNSCTAPEGSAAYGIFACCLPDNACGLQTPLAEDCLPPDAPGGLDPSCPDFSMDPISLRGCCAANGKCGGLDTANLGCIPGDKIGLPDQACTFQPDNNCVAIIAVNCDGPEDCGSGQQCCGRYNGGSYDKFICATSCDDAANAEAGTWSEICHPGQACTNPDYSCAAIQYLPDFLYRCRDTGTLLCGQPNAVMDACVEAVTSGPDEITCGDIKCGAAEKCCIRLTGEDAPREPYCAPADSACQCVTESANTDGGTSDSGTPDSGN